MKKIGITLSLLSICLFSFRTEEIDIYSVIRVIGSITHVENGKDLFTGDKVRSNEQLKFKTDQSKAAVISSKKGRFILTPTTSTKKLGLMPAMNNVSSRAGALINLIDLKNHFKGNYLILSGYEVEISEKSYPMNDNSFFFLRYNFNNEAISKKLGFEGNKLKLDKNEILKIDGNQIELPEGTEMKLFYRDSEKNTSAEISAFIPVFADEDMLKLETKIILEEYSDRDNSTKINEITAYMNEHYGKPHKDNLTSWLKTNFNLN